MGQSEIRLKALGTGDESTAVRLMRDVKGSPAAAPTAFLDKPGSVLFVAMVEDAPVAFAYGYELDRPDGARMMLLYEMEVAPAWRRQGIGRRLVGAFRDQAVQSGCTSMWLITDDDNVSAQMLYQLEGATAEGNRMQYAWRDLGSWL